MPNPGNPDAHEQISAHPREQPILKWACDLAGGSRQSVYEKMERDVDFRVSLRAANAEGQRQRLKGVSDERVLAWSDPERFTLRRDHKVESSRGYKRVIAEQWDPASLFDGTVLRASNPNSQAGPIMGGAGIPATPCYSRTSR